MAKKKDQKRTEGLTNQSPPPEAKRKRMTDVEERRMKTSRTMRAIRRLANQFPASTLDERLSTIAGLASGELDPETVSKRRIDAASLRRRIEAAKSSGAVRAALDRMPTEIREKYLKLEPEERQAFLAQWRKEAGTAAAAETGAGRGTTDEEALAAYRAGLDDEGRASFDASWEASDADSRRSQLDGIRSYLGLDRGDPGGRVR